jgi:3-dehydroquinate synthase
MSAMETLTVALGARSYPIHLGSGVLREAGRLLAPQLPAPRTVIVSNPTVATRWHAPLRDSLSGSGIAVETVLIPDGEVYKTWATLNDVLTQLLEQKIERSTTLIALGGGVVGDLAGFAAAIYQRGIPFVQIPTTLLSQVDSSVGGKTGVNHLLGKNMIGAFYQPRAVLIDTDCLATLPAREFSAGLAEVVKHGAIRARGFFEWLETNIEGLLAHDAAALTHAIAESCRIKAAIVAADERESGVRMLLNFGHTFGHAIETAAGYGEWLHGEAVAAGMVLAAELSRRVTCLAADEAKRLTHLLAQARLPIQPPPIPYDRWVELISRDKKSAGGVVRFVLLEALGRATVRSGVADGDLRDVVSGCLTRK